MTHVTKVTVVMITMVTKIVTITEKKATATTIMTTTQPLK